MRTGIVVSAIAHVVLLTIGLINLGQAKPLEPVTESIAVDLVPISDVSSIRVGSLDSKVVETPTPSAVETNKPIEAKPGNTEQKPITISVTNDGAIFLGEQPVAIGDLVAQVAASAVNGTEDRIYVRGDLAANYGSVMQVMGALSGAGYAKIGLITEQAPQQDQ